MLGHLKTAGEATGGGCICRTFQIAELAGVDGRSEFTLALDLFAPLIGLCAPTLWDAEVRQSQRSVESKALAVAFDPTSVADGRKKVLAEVARRQGQGKFRTALYEAYGGKCAISGCSTQVVLQAAHITPYRGPASLPILETYTWLNFTIENCTL